VSTIRWSPRAAADLERIYDRINRDAPPYASLVVQRIVSAVDSLGDFPRLGRVVPERADPNIRELIVRPYRVVYRTLTDAVEIVTVFHAAQRFPSV
jgi:plasmid stabilization system protein ParE